MVIAKKISASKDEIYVSILAIAQKLKESGKFSLPLKTYFSALPSPIANAMLDENLFTSSETVIRFSFDQMAEYLVSEAIHTDMEESDWEKNFAEADDFHLAVLPWVIAKKEQKGENITMLLETLSNIIENGRTDLLPLFNNIIIRSEKPGNYLPLITGLYESTKIDRSYTIAYYLSTLINNIVLPTAQKIILLRTYFLYQNHYPWREKDWDSISFNGFTLRNFNDSYDTLQLFKNMLFSEPEIVFPAIAPWLQDRSSLNSMEGSIATVAGALFFQFSNLNPTLITDILAAETEKGGEKAEYFLRKIARKIPVEMVSVLETWHKASEHRKMTLDICNVILTMPGEAYYQTLYPIVETFMQEEDIDTKYKCASALLKYKKHTKEMIQVILSLSKENPNYLYILGNSLDAHFDDIFPAIDDVIKNSRYTDDIDISLTVLFGGKYSNEHLTRLADSLDEYLNVLKANKTLHHRLAFSLEELNYKIEPGCEAYQKLLGLIKRFVMEIHPDHINSVFYALTDFRVLEKQNDLLFLIEWCIDNPAFKPKLQNFAELFVRNAIDNLDAKVVHRIIKRSLLADPAQPIVVAVLSELVHSHNSTAFEILRLLPYDIDLNYISKLASVKTLIESGEFHTIEDIRPAINNIIFSRHS